MWMAAIKAIKSRDYLKAWNKELAELSFKMVEPIQLTTMMQKMKTSTLTYPLSIKLIWSIPLSYILS